MSSNDIFLTLQFLEVHLNGRKYSPKQSMYYWTHLACINVLFSFRVTGKKWTELVPIVRVPVLNFIHFGDYCLIYPAVTDLRAINAHTWMRQWNPCQLCPYQAQVSQNNHSSANFCLMVKWDFTLTFRGRCFQHYLQNKMWLYRYLKEDNPRPHFINYDRVHVLKEASRIQYLHLKILFKEPFFIKPVLENWIFFFIM